MNYCNCPNCQTDNCPNALSESAQADSVQRVVSPLVWRDEQCSSCSGRGWYWLPSPMTARGIKKTKCEKCNGTGNGGSWKRANDQAHRSAPGMTVERKETNE